jgi:ABC-type transport system involved in cytochrome c biogenesis ATPase subunit
VQKTEIVNLKNKLQERKGKYFKELPLLEKAEVFLMLMAITGCRIFILDDFYARIEPRGIKRLDEKLTLIRQQGGLVIYFYKALISNVPLKSDGCTVICKDLDRYIVNEL